MKIKIERFTGQIEGTAYCHLMARAQVGGDSVMVGYAKLRKEDGESAVYLYDLIVTHGLRRQGVAREICRNAEAVARNAGLGLAAYTSPGNEGSQAFFRAIGWRHYHTDEDGNLWWSAWPPSPTQTRVIEEEVPA